MLALVAMAACAVPLALGPDRRHARAWVALGVMVFAIGIATVAGTAGAHLIGGLIALLASPVPVARAARSAVVPGLHRSAALLLTAWCLFTAAGSGSGSDVSAGSHHGPLDAGAVITCGYLLVAVVVLTHESRRAGKAAPRFALCGEVGLMAAAMTAMSLAG